MNHKLIIIFLTLFVFSVAHLSAAEFTPTEQKLMKLLPDDQQGNGFRWESALQFYHPDNLFEYINGSADLYLAYDFKELVTVNLIDNDENSLLIDIYDMGDPLNAFGVYSVYRNPASNFQPIGTEGIVSDYHIRFYHSQYIIDLNASDATDELQTLMTETANKISAKISAAKEQPDILNLLPAEDRIAKTEKYIRGGLLGHRFFPRGLEALYKIGQNNVKAFIVLCDSPESASGAMNQYKTYLQTQGKNFAEPEIGETTVISAAVPYHDNTLAAQTGRYLYGMIDLKLIEDGTKLMQLLRAQIETRAK